MFQRKEYKVIVGVEFGVQKTRNVSNFLHPVIEIAFTQILSHKNWQGGKSL